MSDKTINTALNWRNTTFSCLVFLSLGFLLTVPAFYQGLIVSDDILVYSNWHKCFSDQLIAGEWYPRWLMDMNGGRGSPVFFYYPPLSFYISALFEFILPHNYPGWYALYLSFGLALGLSGLTSFLLLKNYTQDKIALILAVFYMLAPYHLFVNFYHRFAYPEFWAFTWTPLVFYFLSNRINSQKKINIGLSISYALILITHIPTFIIITPIILIYSFFIYKDKILFIYILFSLLIGFFVSSFYVIPMLFYKKYVNIGEMFDGKYLLYNNFLMSSESFNNDYYLRIAFINLIIILVLNIAIEKPVVKKYIFWFGVGYFSIFLMFDISSFFWHVIPLIDKIQFPWRLNQFTLISIIVLTSSVFNQRFKDIFKEKRILKFMIIFMLVVQVSSVFMQILPFSKSNMSDEELARTDHETKVKLGVIEYIPRWASDETLSSMTYRNLDQLEPKITVSEDAEARILNWLPRMIELHTSSDKNFSATIRQFYFPLWRATLNQDESFIEVVPSQNGLTKLSIPSGQNIITLKLVKGKAEVIGCVISILTMLLIFYLSLKKYF